MSEVARCPKSPHFTVHYEHNTIRIQGFYKNFLNYFADFPSPILIKFPDYFIPNSYLEYIPTIL